MKNQSIRYAAYILIILGWAGRFSNTGPSWASLTLIGLGIVIILITMFNRPKE